MQKKIYKPNSLECLSRFFFKFEVNRFKSSSEDAAKQETIIHEKVTLVESILGVIYLEFGLEVLLRVVPLIQ